MEIGIPKKVSVTEQDITITIEGRNDSDAEIDDMLEMFKGMLQAWGYNINGELVVEKYED